MAYEMKDSPAKRGDIEGTSGHASALKAKSLIVKYGPKIVQGVKNLFRSGKNVSKKSEDFWKGIKSQRPTVSHTAGGGKPPKTVITYPRVNPGEVSKIPNTTTLASGEVIPFDATKRQMLDPEQLLK